MLRTIRSHSGTNLLEKGLTNQGLLLRREVLTLFIQKPNGYSSYAKKRSSSLRKMFNREHKFLCGAREYYVEDLTDQINPQLSATDNNS